MSDAIEAESSDRDMPGLTGRNRGGGTGVHGAGDGVGVVGEMVSEKGMLGRGLLGGIEPINGEPAGVYGESSNRGVVGQSDVGIGIYGHTNSGTAISGEGPNGKGIISGLDPKLNKPVGVYGESRDHGVIGRADNGTGVYGESDRGTAIFGRTPGSNGLIGGVDPIFAEEVGVYGESQGRGVLGYGTSSDAIGVQGNSERGVGVRGETGSGIAVQGISTQDGLAGRFDGDVEFTGQLRSTNPGGLHIDAGRDMYVAAQFITFAGRPIILAEDFVEVRGKLQVTMLSFGGGDAMYVNDNGYHVDAAYVNFHAVDLLLDGRSRQTDPNKRYRALVDMSDKLVINCAGDYTQGVELQSDLFVSGALRSAGGDCAEHFDIAADAIGEPGTVMVIRADGTLGPCGTAYDSSVAGVISGGGDLKAALILNERAGHRAPMALVGTVYVKVDASHAPIAAGDLLTTSYTPGHAMKAIDREKFHGAIIGKALQPLAGGTGLIPMLVSPS